MSQQDQFKMEEDMVCSLSGPPKLIQQKTEYQYDVLVIGGGSGGLACAKECKNINKDSRVALADYVEPTPHGTQWGIGGTCVNVGCIPKKLMHFAGQVGQLQRDQRECGWELPQKVNHNWDKMVHNVQAHIRRINWGYHMQLESAGIQYFNMKAKFLDEHRVLLTDKDGMMKEVTVDKIVIACGGRPRFPAIPGAKEYGISSDDIFSFKKSPGKTLVVGASYVALECAGFLTGLGYEVKVMVRSIFLRGFDQDMAERVGAYMEGHGTEFLRKCTPTRLQKLNSGKIRVHYVDEDKNELFESFDTVMFGIGRDPVTPYLDLQKAGLKVQPSLKLKTNIFEQTKTSNIYCIGDCAQGRPELTPTAIKAGRILAKRLVSNTIQTMDYENVATVVFTPLEYGCIGMTQVQAKQKYGEDNIQTYHTAFKPLQWNFLPDHQDNTCYIKQLVHAKTRTVLGFHIVAPNAGDITQGVAIAIKCNVTKEQFDSAVGIHPTVAQEVIGLDKTKEQNPNATKTSC